MNEPGEDHMNIILKAIYNSTTTRKTLQLKKWIPFKLHSFLLYLLPSPLPQCSKFMEQNCRSWGVLFHFVFGFCFGATISEP